MTGETSVRGTGQRRSGQGMAGWMRDMRSRRGAGEPVSGVGEARMGRKAHAEQGPRGARGWWGGLALMVWVGLVVSGTPAWAVHDLNLLKLDGTATAQPTDWNDINPPVGGGAIPPLSQSGATARVFVPQCVTQTSGTCVPAGTSGKVVEDPNGDGTYFTTGGSKDGNDLDQWQWGAFGAPDKDEITNAYAASFTNQTAVGQNAVGDTIIYFGMDRFATNGDANVAFWFFVGSVGRGGTAWGGGSGRQKAGVGVRGAGEERDHEGIRGVVHGRGGGGAERGGGHYHLLWDGPVRDERGCERGVLVFRGAGGAGRDGVGGVQWAAHGGGGGGER